MLFSQVRHPRVIHIIHECRGESERKHTADREPPRRCIDDSCDLVDLQWERPGFPHDHCEIEGEEERAQPDQRAEFVEGWDVAEGGVAVDNLKSDRMSMLKLKLFVLHYYMSWPLKKIGYAVRIFFKTLSVLRIRNLHIS